jgi:hypothetical protein
VRRKRLLKELGGLRGVKAATLEGLKDVPWLPDKVAEAIYAKIHTPSGAGVPAAVTGGVPSSNGTGSASSDD